MKRRLGILILSDPGKHVFEFIQGLCGAARGTDVEVAVFFMGDGVRCLEEPHLRGWLREGGRVCFCALNAMERDLDQQDQYPWGMEEGSQYDMACIAERSDRLIAFT
jgi:hypothetical protein